MVQTIALNLVMVGFVVFGIAALMEWYKKTFRKDKATKVENIIVATVLSLLGAVMFKVAGWCIPNITLIFKNASPWFDAIVYAALIFVLQMQADMKTLKAIMKICGPLAMSADFRALVAGFIGNTGVTANQIVAAMKLMGITADKAKDVLMKLDVDETAAGKIADELKKAIEETNAVKADVTPEVEA